MAINIFVFFLPLLFGVNVISMTSRYLWSIGASFGPSIVMEGEIWRLFSAMFLHGGIKHVLMNMLSLFLVGRSVERLFSKVSYLFIYFISGLIGSLVSIYFHPVTVGVGASGAIFGIFGAVVGFTLVQHKRRYSKFQNFIKSIGIALVYHKKIDGKFQNFIKSVGIVLLLNLGIGLFFPYVDMSAHIGGMIAGTIGGAVVAKYPKNLWLYILIAFVVIALMYSYLVGYVPTQLPFKNGAVY